MSTSSPVVITDAEGKSVDLATPEKKIQEPNSGAEATALALGYIRQEDVIGPPQRIKGALGRMFLLPTVRGRKALVGQYTTPIMSPPYEANGRQYPARQIGKLDMSEVINSYQGRYNKPTRQKYIPLAIEPAPEKEPELVSSLSVTPEKDLNETPE